MEEDAARSGQRLAQLSKEELEVLWESAKKFERDEAKQELKSWRSSLERFPDCRVNGPDQNRIYGQGCCRRRDIFRGWISRF